MTPVWDAMRTARRKGKKRKRRQSKRGERRGEASSSAISEAASLSVSSLPAVDGTVEDLMWGEEEKEEEDEEEAPSWNRALAGPEAVSFACIRIASGLLSQPNDVEFHRIATVFYRYSIQHLLCKTLSSVSSSSSDKGAGCSTDFLTLDSVRFLSAANDRDNDQRIASIVSSAESEAGQSVVRDLVLSFLLPPEVVGVRRVLVIDRATSTRATLDYSKSFRKRTSWRCKA